MKTTPLFVPLLLAACGGGSPATSDPAAMQEQITAINAQVASGAMTVAQGRDAKMHAMITLFGTQYVIDVSSLMTLDGFMNFRYDSILDAAAQNDIMTLQKDLTTLQSIRQTLQNTSQDLNASQINTMNAIQRRIDQP